VAEKGTRPSMLGNKLIWAGSMRVALNTKADGPSKLTLHNIEFVFLVTTVYSEMTKEGASGRGMKHLCVGYAGSEASLSFEW